jgi:hypothetical protein
MATQLDRQVVQAVAVLLTQVLAVQQLLVKVIQVVMLVLALLFILVQAVAQEP